MSQLEKEGVPSESWYNFKRFWEDLMGVRENSSVLVGHFNHYVSRLNEGEIGPGERRIGELLLGGRDESLEQIVVKGDIVKDLDRPFVDFLARLRNGQRWEQEIPLVTELLLVGSSELELKEVYAGLSKMEVDQTKVPLLAWYEVYCLMIEMGLKSDPRRFSEATSSAKKQLREQSLAN